MNGSPKYKLNRDDAVKIAKQAGLVAIVAVVGYFASDVVPNLDVPGSLVFVVPIVVSLLSAVAKWATDTRI